MKKNCLFWFLLWTIAETASPETFKLATSVCLAKHDQLSLYIDFKPNCEKKQRFETDVDDMDPENHICFMMRWYCSKMCTNEGICSVGYLFTLNRKVDHVTGMPLTLDCICGYDRCQKGCSKPIYVTGWKTVDEKFKAECSASCTQNLTIDGGKISYDSGGSRPVPLTKTAAIKCIELSATLIGPSVLTCISDEKWNTNPPYCHQGCPLLTFAASIFKVIYTQKLENKVKYLGTAMINCVEPSSLLTGEPLLTCGKDEQFDQKFPICKPGCTKLTVEPAIKVSYTLDFETKIKFKGTASFQCITLSSTLMGETVLTCQGNEMWNNKQPYCLPGCPTLIYDENIFNVVYTQKFGDKVKYQSTASISCIEKSSTLIGEPLFTCGENEQFDKEFPICKPGCPTLTVDESIFDVVYTQRFGNKVKYEGTASISCIEESSTLLGESLLTCQNEQFDEEFPICKPGCPTFTIDPSVFYVAYKEKFGNKVKYQGTASVRCVKPSAVLGMPLLTCGDDETWDNNFPECQTACTKLIVDLIAMSVSYSVDDDIGTQVNPGTTATFGCKILLHELTSDTPLTCEDTGLWDDYQPICTTARKEHCPLLPYSFYLNKKCFVREELRDMSKNENQCEQLPGGLLMTQKTQAELNQIVDALKDTLGQYPPGTDRVFAIFTENLKPGQTVRIKGQINYLKPNEYNEADEDHYYTRIQLGGITDSDYIQHVALEMNADRIRNVTHLIRFPQVFGGMIGFSEWLKYAPFPDKLRNGQTFDMTIKYRTDSHLEIKLGSFYEVQPYKEEEVHYINFVRFQCRGEVTSITIDDGRELKTADDNDNLYTQCMIVGLQDKNRLIPTTDPKAGWVWNNGESANPVTTLWDTAVGEPNNEFGDEHYACVNTFTYKLRDFPNYLKKYPICEYGLLS